jgi:hypothetical protein
MFLDKATWKSWIQLMVFIVVILLYAILKAMFFYYFYTVLGAIFLLFVLIELVKEIWYVSQPKDFVTATIETTPTCDLIDDLYVNYTFKHHGESLIYTSSKHEVRLKMVRPVVTLSILTKNPSKVRIHQKHTQLKRYAYLVIPVIPIVIMMLFCIIHIKAL